MLISGKYIIALCSSAYKENFDMMLLKIDKINPTPVYLQIVKQVREMIEKEALKAGDNMPSTRALAERLGIHRTTVYKAYEELWALGYIESTPGSYTKIRKRNKLARTEDKKPSGIIDWSAASNAGSVIINGEYNKFHPETNSHSAAFHPDTIDLSRFDLDQTLFPVEDFRKCMNRILAEKGESLLNYGAREGYRSLREYIANRLQIHEVDISADEILITNGSQNGIDLVLKLLAEPGKRIYIESPTYSAVLPLLKYYRLDIAGIPMKEDGMDLDYLADRFEKDGNNGFLYTIPNFQNPTGITTCQNHREALLKLCESHKLPIIEDGFEEEMKYYGKVSLPIKSMDKNNIVIYLGTFSKVLFPGVRIGWIAAEKNCISRITAIKRFSELSSSPVIQAAVHEFCKEGLYDLHIKKMHRIFRKRMQATISALKTYMPPEYTVWKEPVGGYLVWVQLKDCIIETEEISKIMLKHKVIASPGEFYFHEVHDKKYFRISISTLNEQKITEGIKRFASAVREIYKNN